MSEAAILSATAAADAPPPGFRPIRIVDGFVGRNGPLYGNRDGEEPLFGFRVRPDHCNPIGTCHGGWLATVADLVLPLSARLADQEDRLLVTIHLGIDYLAPAPLGAWVEGRGRVLRRTKSMVFVDGVLEVAGEAVLRASGVFRLGPPAPKPVIG